MNSENAIVNQRCGRSASRAAARRSSSEARAPDDDDDDTTTACDTREPVGVGRCYAGALVRRARARGLACDASAAGRFDGLRSTGRRRSLTEVEPRRVC